jgi:hypothetical protein
VKCRLVARTPSTAWGQISVGALQKKRLFWEKEQRWVSLKLSVKAMRTIKKKGLDVVAEEHGLDLYSLPYKDVSDNRLQWKASNPVRPPMAKNPRSVLSVK